MITKKEIDAAIDRIITAYEQDIRSYLKELLDIDLLNLGLNECNFDTVSLKGIIFDMSSEAISNQALSETIAANFKSETSLLPESPEIQSQVIKDHHQRAASLAKLKACIPLWQAITLRIASNSQEQEPTLG